MLGGGLLLLIVQLWAVCFLSKIYSEMLQDQSNDASDDALVEFVWQRRGETWAKLEKFEDVVQRQFEELRMSLVAHAHHAQAASAAQRAAASTARAAVSSPCDEQQHTSPALMTPR